jgi:D-cysteine desulfhydrase
VSVATAPEPAFPPRELALVRRFPALRVLPRVELATLPTPVAPLRLVGLPEGALWIKRDDATSALYGGNKPRKLEFTLADAQSRGARRIVTTGGIGTHHGLATALFARTLGIATTVVVVPQPVTAHVREQLLALRAAGAALVPAEGVLGAAIQVVRALAGATLRGERPYLMPTGGSSALGDVGFVSAAFELAEQIRAGLLPEPAEILVPVGSGGTHAGLVLGAKLAGLPARVVGVLVTDILPPSPRRLARLADATLALLRRHEPSLPAVGVAAADFEVTHAQLGAGYGAPTAAGEAARVAAAAAGVVVEATYTEKCLAEAVARIRDGRARGPLLFWNTFDGHDHAALRAAADAAPALAPRIQRWLAEDPR